MRPEIAKSWRRSRLCGVPADRDLQLSYVPGLDPDATLLRVAGEVLDRLGTAVAGTSTSVVLADSQARILDRRAGEKSLNAHLDKVGLAPGFSYAEELVGTNGIGTAAVERRAVQVVGPEHFLPSLQTITCVGAPIHHPITGRLEGVLDITCRYDDTSDRTLPLVLEAVNEIQDRLYQEATVCERALLEQFLIMTRHSKRPIVSMNEQFIITNVAAAHLLGPADHGLLWQRVTKVLSGQPEALDTLSLTSGLTVLARVREITQDGARAGATIRIDVPRSGRRRGATISVPASSLCGWSGAWQAVCEALVEAGREHRPLLILGEPGVGKVAAACVISTEGGGGRLSQFDAGLAALGSAQFFANVRSRLTDPGGTVVISHLEALDAPKARTLCSLIDRTSDATAPRLIGTMSLEATSQAPNGAQALMDRFWSRVTIPPLRERREDIPELVATLVRLHSSPRHERRCTPEVLQVLANMAWPGNVRELENVIRVVVARRPTGDIGLDDLPVDIQRAALTRRLTAMEQLERNAILAALTQAGGNKAKAASNLGLSRATLYRKVRSLGIDLARFGSEERL